MAHRTFGRWHLSACHPLRPRGGAWWTYVAGHPALAMEVEQYIRNRPLMPAGPVDTVEVEGSKDLRWYQLRPMLDPAGLPNSHRLVVIRRAGLVPASVWAALAAWEASWGRRFRGGVSGPGGQHFPSAVILATDLETWNARDITDPRHPVFVASPWGQYVECKDLDEEQQLRYVRNRLTGSGSGSQVPDDLQALLVERCGGDVVRLRGEVSKLLAVIPPGRVISRPTFDRVISPSPGERFVDALISGDKREALARAPHVGSLRFVLGALDYQCQALHLIYRVRGPRSARTPTRVIAERSNLDPFVVRRLRAYASTYDASKVRARYRLLVAASRRLSGLDGPAPPLDRPDWILVPLATHW